MASATSIKVVKTTTGKTKYQALVWHKGVFYCSKTFDLEKLAREYQEQALRQIVREPPRESRRLLPLREWSYEEVPEVLP
jgi:hypothetical protein